MNTLQQIIQMVSTVAGLIATLVVLVKPLRDKILGMGDVKDGQKCLLRSEMLKIYFNNRESKTIRQYEYENFMYLYQAYKALKGNSFIDKIKKEIDTWTIIS